MKELDYEMGYAHNCTTLHHEQGGWGNLSETNAKWGKSGQFVHRFIHESMNVLQVGQSFAFDDKRV